MCIEWLITNGTILHRELSIKSTIASKYGDNIKAKDFNQLITISQCKYEFAST